MKGMYHAMFGIASSLAIAGLFQYFLKVRYPILDIIALIMLGAFFGMLPDIDHKMSHITWFVLLSSFCLIVGGWYFKNLFCFMVGLCILGLMLAIILLGKHRGFTHTTWFALLASIPVLFFKLNLNFYLSAVFACLSHLIVDNAKRFKGAGK